MYILITFSINAPFSNFMCEIRLNSLTESLQCHCYQFTYIYLYILHIYILHIYIHIFTEYINIYFFSSNFLGIQQWTRKYKWANEHNHVDRCTHSITLPIYHCKQISRWQRQTNSICISLHHHKCLIILMHILHIYKYLKKGHDNGFVNVYMFCCVWYEPTKTAYIHVFR